MGSHTATNSRQENDAVVSFVLRALQLAFSAMALVLAAGSFKAQALAVMSASGEHIVVTTYAGGPVLSFVLLITFSASIYTILWIVFVHLRRSVTLPIDVALAIDALLTVLLISGGCAFLASDYVRYCDLLEKSVRCGVIKTGAAFVLVAFLLFLCSVAWGAYLRLQVKKTKALRGNYVSDVDMLPLEASDLEREGDAAHYVPTTPQ